LDSFLVSTDLSFLLLEMICSILPAPAPGSHEVFHVAQELSGLPATARKETPYGYDPLFVWQLRLEGLERTEPSQE
jgi:hypothetical protein